MGGLSKLDLAVIVAYLAGVTAFGLYVSRRVKDTEGFFMGKGYSLLILDLLRLAQTFSYRRYRVDVIGFLLAWLWVVLLLALWYWTTRIGD